MKVFQSFLVSLHLLGATNAFCPSTRPSRVAGSSTTELSFFGFELPDWADWGNATPKKKQDEMSENTVYRFTHALDEEMAEFTFRTLREQGWYNDAVYVGLLKDQDFKSKYGSRMEVKPDEANPQFWRSSLSQVLGVAY